MLAPAARRSGLVGSTAIVTSSGLVEPGLLTRTLGCWALAGEGWQVEPAAARRPIRWARWRRCMVGGAGRKRARTDDKSSSGARANASESFPPESLLAAPRL